MRRSTGDRGCRGPGELALQAESRGRASWRAAIAAAALLMALACAPRALAQPTGRAAGSPPAIASGAAQWPSWQQWRRVMLLEDYNTQVVVAGTTLLGCAAGIVGSFMLLRKRALMGDALSHAALPGIAGAFMIATSLGFDGKSLPLLLIGATVTGLMGVGCILLIRNLTRLKEDTALGAVLSVFFGAGIALMGVIQQIKGGHAAGLESFIYGKTASMVASDMQLIAATAVVCIVTCLLLFKEFKLLCFDEGFAGSRGMGVLGLDLALMALVVIVCIVGLQAVGLVLMIALLVIPAAAARFWTQSMWRMTITSAALGAAGGMFGAGVSALFANLPSGAMIVLVCTLFFVLSMIFGTARGLLIRWYRRARLNWVVHRQHLLRAAYEILETSQRLPRQPEAESNAVTVNELLAKRSWSPKRLRREIRRAQLAGQVRRDQGGVRLTGAGLAEAERLTRQHRLWELYLITHAEIAPSRVDRDADVIEHVLAADIVEELEQLLAKKYSGVPASPHELTPAGGPSPAITSGGH